LPEIFLLSGKRENPHQSFHLALDTLGSEKQISLFFDSVAHSFIIPFHPAVATLFAFAGIALGVALRKIALHRDSAC
jgi:hypothetical protein